MSFRHVVSGNLTSKDPVQIHHGMTRFGNITGGWELNTLLDDEVWKHLHPRIHNAFIPAFTMSSFPHVVSGNLTSKDPVQRHHGMTGVENATK